MMSTSKMTRREIGRLLALGGSAAALGGRAWAHLPPVPSGDAGDERYWDSVRELFILQPDLAVLNAANLCPSSKAVLDSLLANTRDVDGDPSFPNREKMATGKAATRRLLAEFLRVSPDEIVMARNTSEANNLVSSGIDLKPGDEVILFSDNHPSNHKAWLEKGKRFGYSVRVIDQVNPHPGAEYYIESFTRAMTSRTRVLAFTHLTSTAGDLLPAKELCRIARDRQVLTLVDGAQSFGLMDVDLGEMQPDFYTGSAHKWSCGPKEVGVLYIHRSAQPRIWPSIYSAFPGDTGISTSFEAFGQRDEPAIIAFGEALKLQSRIGRKRIEMRARELSQALIEGLRKIDGIRLWTHPSPERSVAVVTFQPGSLDVRKLSAVLYEKDRIAGATREGADRGGIRFSPHLYNSHREVERILSAIRRYMRNGLPGAA